MGKSISPDWIALISAWAQEVEEIQHVWVYGSYARGEATCCSDLDIAVGLQGSDGERLADWCSNGKSWEAQLQGLIPVKMHLELADPVHTPNRVWPSIKREGMKFFERSATDKSRGLRCSEIYGRL